MPTVLLQLGGGLLGWGAISTPSLTKATDQSRCFIWLGKHRNYFSFTMVTCQAEFTFLSNIHDLGICFRSGLFN